MPLTAIGEGALAHDDIDRLAMYRCISGTLQHNKSYLVLEITEIRCENSENECQHCAVLGRDANQPQGRL